MQDCEAGKSACVVSSGVAGRGTTQTALDSLLGCSILGAMICLRLKKRVCTCNEKGNNAYEIVASYYCYVSVGYFMKYKRYEIYQFTRMKTVEFQINT